MFCKIFQKNPVGLTKSCWVRDEVAWGLWGRGGGGLERPLNPPMGEKGQLK